MSFETVVAISAITEVIVISAIVLTLINAFSHGALARRVFGSKEAPAAHSHAGDAFEGQVEYLRAA